MDALADDELRNRAPGQDGNTDGLQEQHTATQNEAAEPCIPLLHTLAQQGDADKVTQLLDSGEADANDEDGEGISALHWAAMNLHLTTCKVLLAKGAEVDAVGGQLEATPLHWAAR